MYQVLALPFASAPGRIRRDNILNLPPALDGPMPMTFYVWLIRNDERTILVDTGFGPDDAAARGLVLVRSPAEAVHLAGSDPNAVHDVILTHLHFDHVGTLAGFPNARFHVQASELAHATGAAMTNPGTARGYSAASVCDVVQAVFSGRVRVCDGDEEIAPGVTVHLVRSHTPGLQAVRVQTAAGWLVLASDAAIYFENLETGVPSPVLWHLGDMYDALRAVTCLASAPNLIIPGHDPLVMDRFPALSPELSGVVAILAQPGGLPHPWRS